MAIIASDLKFLPAERNVDVFTTVDGQGGGGFSSSPVVQDGVSNNVFPDVMPADRTTGRRQLRRVFPAVLSNENSLAANVGLAFSARQTDANVEICAFAPNAASWGANAPRLQRSSFWAAQALDGLPMTTVALGTATVVTNSVGNLQSFAPASGVVLGTTVKVGDKVQALCSTGSVDWRTVTAVNSGAGTLTLSGSFVWTAGSTVTLALYTSAYFDVSAPALTTGSLSIGNQDLTVDRMEVRTMPLGWTAATPGFNTGDSVGSFNTSYGRGALAPIFRVGSKVLIQHPSTSGTREVKTIESINYHTGVVRVTTGLANAYPTGAIVSLILELGDLRANVSLAPFSQQAWGRVWADTVSGPAITPRYSGVIGMNNAGCIDERWAIVFTSTTAFDLIGERLGLVASGNTSSNFLPLNPYTSQPLMSLPSSGWGGGWLNGNTVRFNTKPAHAGPWLSRVVSPSAAGGTDQAKLIIRADVDA